jgi:NTE family protein
MKWTGGKIGLALGGGGVRGFSHIGVLKVLDQAGIGIDLIVGTSAGALIGGAYASGQSPAEIEAKLEAYLKSPEFEASALKSLGLAFSPQKQDFLTETHRFLKNQYYLIRGFFRNSVLPAGDFESLIDFFIPDLDIRQTRIPFRAVATDLFSGETVVLYEGPLRQAVLASCAVPGTVAPLVQGKRLLADGGISSLVPVRAAREAGADMVIAVLVDRELSAVVTLETAQDIVDRACEITTGKLQEAETAGADVVIRPQVGDLHWMDFSRAGDLVRQGEAAARASLGRIQAALPLSRRISRLRGRIRKAGGF